MELLELKLKNIGPFNDAFLDFRKSNEKGQVHPITIITGENGTGKTILLDAIRGALYGGGSILDRDIISRDNDSIGNFEIQLGTRIEEVEEVYIFNKNFNNSIQLTSGKRLSNHAIQSSENANFNSDRPFPYVLAYWTERTDNRAMKIDNFVNLNPKQYLKGALSGIQSNSETIEIITYFDYLRGSGDSKEQTVGNFLYQKIIGIINSNLTDGKFVHVRRKDLMPIVSQIGHEVEISQISSGNRYIIQRMISLLAQCYAVYELYDYKDVKEITNVAGVLLIDEAENNLHPKWQKSFLNQIHNLFPNIQIIATTHSPFIVSSVENAKVFVCKSMENRAVVEDQSAIYSNKSIQEILASDVFNETTVFNNKVSKYLEEREVAITNKDFSKAEKIEQMLKEINPIYFGYLGMERKLEEL